jgi:hypothetical protein
VCRGPGRGWKGHPFQPETTIANNRGHGVTTVVRGRHGRRRRDGPYGFVTGPASSRFFGSSTTVVSLAGAALVSSFCSALFEFACEVEKLLKDMVAPFGQRVQLFAPYPLNGGGFLFFQGNKFLC